MNCIFCKNFSGCPVRVELTQQDLWDCFDSNGYDCKFGEETFLTPSQYEKRTGKKWNGAVWIRADAKSPWYVQRWLVNEKSISLCANSPEPPPDDFVPEEE